MIIKQIVALFGGTVLMALAGFAGAGTNYNVNASPTGGATGTYHVSIYEDSIFSFHISSGFSNDNAPSMANVDQVRLIFYTGLNGTGATVQSTATLLGGTNAGVWSNWGIAHTHFGSPGYTQYSGNASTAIMGNGSNQFQQQAGGYFNLANSNAHSVEVELQTNGNPTWVGVFNITDFVVPETSSFALLLPGLVPLSIALRRRVARK